MKLKTTVLLCLSINYCLYSQITVGDVKELSLAHKKSLNYSNLRDYLNASNCYTAKSKLIDELANCNSENDFSIKLSSNNLIEYKDSIGMWLADFGYYHLKAKDYNLAIGYCKIVNVINPLNSWAFLVRADATYDLGNPIEAIIYYREFIELMKKKGNENIIPKRVIERAKA
jgi:tetratricopeptide (TPR) repeat protein